MMIFETIIDAFAGIFIFIILIDAHSMCIYNEDKRHILNNSKNCYNKNNGLFHFISILPLLRSTNYVLGGYLVDVL